MPLQSNNISGVSVFDFMHPFTFWNHGSNSHEFILIYNHVSILFIQPILLNVHSQLHDVGLSVNVHLSHI